MASRGVLLRHQPARPVPDLSPLVAASHPSARPSPALGRACRKGICVTQDDIEYLRSESDGDADYFIDMLKTVIGKLPGEARSLVFAALQDEIGADVWVRMRRILTASVHDALLLFEYELEDEVTTNAEAPQ